MELRPKSGELTLRDYKQRMLRVLVHIQGHLDEGLGLEQLAEIACFSSYHFHRVFKGMLGECLMGHIRRLRLERAATQLKITNMPVTQIAFGAGYETHEAFTRAFKGTFGFAPKEYRERKGTARQVKARSGVHYVGEGQLKNFKTTGVWSMKVEIKTIKPMRVAFMRHVGPYDEVGVTWDQLLTWMGKEGLLGGSPLFIGICHDDPDVTVPEKIRYDACVTVGEDFSPTGEVGVQVVAGGEYAVTTHFGPYNRLGETYSKMMGQWLPRSGRELAAKPCFDIYLNDPQSTEPEDLLTDIYVPLKPKR